MLLDVFVADDRLDGGVRVVDQQLVNSFERHFRLVIFVVGVKAQDRFFFLACLVLLFTGFRRRFLFLLSILLFKNGNVVIF